MRGQQQADPSGRNPCVTRPGLPLTPRLLLDLPETSEGQGGKVPLPQNGEGLKIKGPSLPSSTRLPAANTVGANKCLTGLGLPTCLPVSVPAAAAAATIRRKAPTLKP